MTDARFDAMVKAAARAMCNIDREIAGWPAMRSAADFLEVHGYEAYFAKARVALTAALAAVPGLVVTEDVGGREYLEGDGEHVDAANAGTAGHNTCRAEFLRRAVRP